MFDKDKYYTIKEIKELSGIGIQTLYKRIYATRVPVRFLEGVYKVGGQDAPQLLPKRKRGRKSGKVNLVV